METHKIQREILRELSFADKLSFGDFKIRSEIDQDQFNYHLQAMVKSGLLFKDPVKKYSLTTNGKVAIQYMDVTNNMKDMRMPKVAVQLFVLKNNKVLLSKRMRHPFKDYFGFASGKVTYGEDFEETLKREAFEELGITPTHYKLYAIRRCIDLDNEGSNVIHDAIYYVYLITAFQGEIVDTEESKNEWFDLNSIQNMEILPVTKILLDNFQNSNTAKPFFDSMTSKALAL